MQTNAAAPRQDQWKVIGPGGGGTMIRPTISPHDTRRICLMCDMTGAYISADGGESWRMFNLRNWVTTYAYDPSDANVIYTANAALWRSEDAGRTWAMVWPDPKRSVEHMRGDGHDDEAIRKLVFANANAFYSRSPRWKPDLDIQPMDPRQFQR